jgi:hypothetical protein
MSDVDALHQSRTYENIVQQILAYGFLLGEQTTEAFDVHTLDVRAG